MCLFLASGQESGQFGDVLLQVEEDEVADERHGLGERQELAQLRLQLEQLAQCDQE